MSERDGKPSEKALTEFLSEAQEIVEALGRDLLALDEQRAQGRIDPETVNEAFRAVHSLKGLSGLFGVARMVNLSHNLENLLDGLRLGRGRRGPGRPRSPIRGLRALSEADLRNLARPDRR